jgi:hypothetical protein
MVEFIHEFPFVVEGPEGRRYRARVYGGRAPGLSTWEGWFVFFPIGGGEPLPTDRETTQSKLEHVRYWAGGIEPLYLEGALDRAIRRSPEAVLARRIAHGRAVEDLLRAEEEAYRLALHDLDELRP